MGKYLDNSCKNLRQRYQTLRTSRASVEEMWQEIENYVLPFRGEFFKRDSTEMDVQWKKRWIYDSVPVESAQTLSASLNGSLTTPLVKWFTLMFREDDLNADKEASEWLQASEDAIFLALNESNFNLEANELYTDLVGFGNGVVVEEIDGTYEDFRGLDFKAIPIKECFFETDYRDKPKRFYRRVLLTPVQIVDKFGPDAVPETIRERALSPAGVDTKEEVVFAIYERESITDEIEAGNLDITQPIPPERRPYGYKWFLDDTAERLGDEGGYYEMPAFIVRWRKVSGSMWGFGPAHVSMGDILTLNELVDQVLSAGSKVLDPATIVEDRGIVGDLDLDPGGLTVVRRIDGIMPYESRARFDVSQLQKDELRASIRRMFFVDQLELKESPAMTATEVNVRYEMMQRLLGPTLGRLQSDFLDPLISRTFNIMLRANQLPEIPASVRQRAAQMDIEYSGPMARAQRSEQVATIERFVAGVAQVAEIYPEVLDIIDPMAMAREEARLAGVPSKILRSDAEIQSLQEERAQQQQMQQAMMAAQQGGEAMRSMGEGMQAIQEGGVGGVPTAEAA